MKTLLVSMPWADYQLPSLQIGALAAYARERGFDVEARHLHLEVAALFDFFEYDKIICDERPVKEPLFAALLYPERKIKIQNILKKSIERPDRLIKRLLRAVTRVYRSTDWGKYDLVGFTLNFDQLFASILFAKWLKRDFPKIKILFGGTLVAGSLGRSILECFPEVDWCVDGEGESAFLGLLECIEANRDSGINVPGLIYRQNEVVKINPKRQLPDLKNLPDPDYDHYFWLLDNHPSLKKKEVVTYVPVEASRGCPHNCAFCSVHGCWRGYRLRPPEEVAGQFKRMSERYRINRFYIVDYNTLSKYFDSLIACIKNHNIDCNIAYMIRADFDKSQIMAMKEAGVHRVQIGIEAISPTLLCKMNKGVRVIDNIKAMKYCEELEIEHTSNLIIEFPTESQREVDETEFNIDYVSAYRPPKKLNPFELEYGSPVYNQHAKFGICSVTECGRGISKLLPHGIARRFIYAKKGYGTEYKPRRYDALFKRYKRWCDEYNEARLREQVILGYYDGGTFLRIEDFRSGVRALTLEEKVRDLYMFCDSIRSFDEIKRRFSKWNRREIKKVLNKLVKLKVMFREDDDYLSLAIRAIKPCGAPSQGLTSHGLKAPTRAYDVVIVGGGLAGLTAAYLLKDYKVLVLEKENYLGGRVLTCTKNNVSYDVGAIWAYPSKIVTSLKHQPSLLIHEHAPVGLYYKGEVYLEGALVDCILGMHLHGKLSEKEFLELQEFVVNKNFNASSLQKTNYALVDTCFKTIHPASLKNYLPRIQKDAFRDFDANHYSSGNINLINDYLRQLNCEIQLNRTVVSVEDAGEFVKIAYIENGKQKTIRAKTAIVATHGTVATKILKKKNRECVDFLQSVQYGQFFVVVIAFKDTVFKNFKYILTHGLATNVIIKQNTVSENIKLIYAYYGDHQSPHLRTKSKRAIIQQTLNILRELKIGNLQEKNIVFTDLIHWQEGGTVISAKSYLNWSENNRHPSRSVFLCGDYLYVSFPYGMSAAIASAQQIISDVIREINEKR